MDRTPDDPNDEPTRMADYDYRDYRGYRAGGDYSEPAAYSDEYREPTGQRAGWPAPPEPPPTPWYLRPLALVGLGVLTALLITALVWGMVRLVNRESGHTTPATTSVSSAPGEPADSPAGPGREPAAPGAPTDENVPPATTTEPPASTTEAPSTTEPPSTTAPTTTTKAPTTTTQPTTTAAPTTTSAAPSTTASPEQPPS